VRGLTPPIVPKRNDKCRFLWDGSKFEQRILGLIGKLNRLKTIRYVDLWRGLLDGNFLLNTLENIISYFGSGCLPGLWYRAC